MQAPPKYAHSQMSQPAMSNYPAFTSNNISNSHSNYKGEFSNLSLNCPSNQGGPNQSDHSQMMTNQPQPQNNSMAGPNFAHETPNSPQVNSMTGMMSPFPPMLPPANGSPHNPNNIKPINNYSGFSGSSQILHQSSNNQTNAPSNYNGAPTNYMPDSNLASPLSQGGPPTPFSPAKSYSGPPMPVSQPTNHGGPQMPFPPPMSHSGHQMPHSQPTSHGGPSMNYGGPPMPHSQPTSHCGPSMNYGGPPMPPPPNLNHSGPPMPSPTNPSTMPPQFTNSYASGPQYPGMNQQHLTGRLPNALDVYTDDRAKVNGYYSTNMEGRLPPIVNTDFITQDQGVSGPRFFRSSMMKIPRSPEMLKQTNLPLVIGVTPFAKQHPQELLAPLSDMGSYGPVRCRRCKAYMNPMMTFRDGGTNFICCLCRSGTPVPEDYFNHLDQTGRRVDCYQRPELCLGSFDMTVTADYCKEGQPPNPPAFIFMIDVSMESVRTGFLNYICSNFQEIIDSLPRENESETSCIDIGFITFSQKSVNFYNLNPRLTQPQISIVTDLNEMFCPISEGFFVNIMESENQIATLMDMLPSEAAEASFSYGGGSSQSASNGISLAGAISAGLESFRSSQRSGKIFVLQIGPVSGIRMQQSQSKSDNKELLTPSTDQLSCLGEQCVQAGCGVDLFLCDYGEYTDLVTLAETSRVSGGRLYRYPKFKLSTHGSHLLEDMKNSVRKTRAFDAVMRVRTSLGLRGVEFYGHHWMSNTTDVQMGALDDDSTLLMEMKHDDKLEGDMAYMQAVVLHTTLSGQRRVRVHNLALPVTSRPDEAIQSVDTDLLMCYTARSMLRNYMNPTSSSIPTMNAVVGGGASTSSTAIPTQIVDKCAAWLAACKRLVSGVSGDMCFPDCLKLAPLYCNSLAKCDIFNSSGNCSMDDRCFLVFRLSRMSPAETIHFLYPRLFQLHTVDYAATEFHYPSRIRCSYERLDSGGIYLLDNGLVSIIWLGRTVASSWLEDLFEVSSLESINMTDKNFQFYDNVTSQYLKKLLMAMHSNMNEVSVVIQNDKSEMQFKRLLVEDQSDQGGSSYADFMLQLQQAMKKFT